MSYEPKTWGNYTWDPNKSLNDNIILADAANALIETTDMQRIENGIDDLDSNVAGKFQNGTSGVLTGSQSEYEAIVEKDPKTVYVVTE